MVINVSEILKVYGAKVNVDGEISLPETAFLGEAFVFTEPMKIKGSIVNNGKALELNADCAGTMKVHCARCTKEIDEKIEFHVNELLMKDDGEVAEDEDIVLFEGYSVDITDIVINHFLMNVSGKYLCDDDCKGLCPKCGQNLNEGECGCDNTVIDPRWAGLADIMNKSIDEN